MTWQPIETAPKDGTKVILFFPDIRSPAQIGHFVDSEEFAYGKSASKRQYWWFGWMGFGKSPAPSHWMPLPSAPDPAPGPEPTP